VIIDWFALVIVFVVRSTLRPSIEDNYVLALNAGAVVVAAPFLVGLLRSGHRLLSHGRATVRGGQSATPRARAVEAFALLAVVLAIGLPTLAVVSPLIRGPWPAVAALAILLAVLLTLGLRLGQLRGSYSSGVARLAIEVAQRVGSDESTESEDDAADVPAAVTDIPTPSLLEGIDYEPIAVVAGSAADGATLAELDLRCQTGATVVAAFHADSTTTLPTGHEALAANDVLAVAGSPAALERARVILTQPALKTTEPG
jgi:CPA2 family monovalent cation:H+ antiporter-2